MTTTGALFDIECGIDTETAGLPRHFPVASAMGYKRQRGVAQ